MQKRLRLIHVTPVAQGAAGNTAHGTRMFNVAVIIAAVSLAAVLAEPSRAEKVLVSPQASASPAAIDPAGVEFFEKRVRPVLVAQCYKCHSTTSEKVKGGLVLDSRAAAVQGGETGPAVVPGHPEKSLLIQAVKYTNDDTKMPPKSQLPANVVADLVKWVQMGAPWPNEKVAAAQPAAAYSPTANYDKARKEHWAWQPLHDVPAPAIQYVTWPRNDIDRYILAKLEPRGMHPVEDADKITLIRRVTFDLTGLPPSVEDVGSFVADNAPDAFEKRVDELLASPAFGERWGRHWLDVARYAESTGSSRNVPYSYAWRYRDYVIDAFNKDKSYNQFITEQIAGDLLPAKTATEHNEHLVATGFLAMGVKDLNEKDRAKYVMDNVDEQIDVTTRSVMALTVACARCHDHKFDPIPTADYYALAGIFRSTDILSGVHMRNKAAKSKDYGAPEMLVQLDTAGAADAKPAPTAAAADPRIRTLSSKLSTLQSQMQALRRDGAAPAVRKAKRQEIQQTQAELDALRGGAVPSAALSGGPAMGVRDGQVADVAVCLHGEPHDLGPEAPRGFITLLPHAGTLDRSHSGRLELAAWLTNPENPMTARVMVNRIWAHLFGAGIVRTVDNFGTTGEAPANPELLDHLAAQFMKEGWSVKGMVREMVLSRAYQMSSATNAQNFNADPGNRLTWRVSSRRLDAEEIRDAVLVASGKLDRTHPQGSPVSGLPVAELRKIALSAGMADGTFRSAYLPILRDLVPPVLDLFDFAEPTMVIGSRDTTTVATQALFLMNDPFMVEQSQQMADRVLNATGGLDDAARVDLAYRIALSRPATAAERTRAMKYLNDFRHDAPAPTLAKARAASWASFCQALLAGAEFRYLN